MLSLPARATSERFKPETFWGLAIIHILALTLAPFTFSWPGFIAFAILYFMTGCLGITLCYHRLLTHRSFRTPRLIRYFLAIIGCLALEGGPIWWVATHRLHHRESDKPMDPHSPNDGFWWSHMLWVLYIHPDLEKEENASKFALELYNDPGMRFIEKYNVQFNYVLVAVLLGIGYALGGWPIALSMLVWGGFLRIVAVWHVTWLVNSATHVWGYKNYEKTGDDSRNNWLVAALTFGEGWHNNHHANQAAARSGHRWWEVDLTYGIIKLMQVFGLAYKILPVTRKVDTGTGGEVAVMDSTIPVAANASPKN